MGRVGLASRSSFPLVLREAFRPASQNQPGLLPVFLERLKMTGTKSPSPTEEHLDRAEIRALLSKGPSPALRGKGQWEGPYLLGGCVFDGVGVVIIVDDVQVLHGISRKGAAELYVQRGFSSPFGVDREVGWFPVFHTWKDRP